MSEILGTILLTAVTVAVLGGFGLAVLTTVSSTSQPPTGAFSLSAPTGARYVDVTFVSGSAFPLSSANYAIGVNATPSFLDGYLKSASTAGRFSPGDVMRVNLTSGAPPVGPGSRILFIATDKTSSKPIGLTQVSLLTATTQPAFLQNTPTVSTPSLTPDIISADGAQTSLLTARVGSSYGLRLMSLVTADLSGVGGPSAAVMRDDGTAGDLLAGDGNYSITFAAATMTFPPGQVSASFPVRVTATDSFGHTATSATTQIVVTPPGNQNSLATNKFGLGAISRNIPSSATIGNLTVTNFTFRDVTKLPQDAIIFRVSDLKNYTRTWVVEIDFDYCGAPLRPAISSLIFSRDGVTGAGGATTATWTPAGSCFPISTSSIVKINLAHPDKSINFTGQTMTWSTAGDTATFSYIAAGIGPLNEGIVVFSGDTSPTANPHTSTTDVGIGTADLVWTVSNAPTASFTVTTTGLQANVDASGSSDPQGLPLTYSWNWGDGSPAGSGKTTSHTYATAGVYTIALTVTDTQGLVGSTSQMITADRNPTASFTLSVTGSAQISVDASTSSDPDGQAITYRWTWGDGSTYGPVPNATTTHKYASSGTYTAQLTVTDPLGGTGTTSKTIGQAPTASFTANPQGWTVGTDASASTDPAGLPLTYTWTWGDGSTYGPVSNATTTHKYASAATRTIQLTVTDTWGATGTTSQSVTTTGKTWFACPGSAVQGTIAACGSLRSDTDGGGSATFTENTASPDTFDGRFTGTGFAETGRTHTLTARAQQTGSASTQENLYLLVWDPTTSNWIVAYTFSSPTMTTSTPFVLTSAEWNAGAPLVRFADTNTWPAPGGSDSKQSTWDVDFIEVTTS